MAESPIGMTFEMAKAAFFDRANVKARLDPVKRRVLSKFGAIGMRRDRGSLKEATGISAAGTPPHLHVSRTVTKIVKRGKKAGQARASRRFQFRDSVLFAADLQRETVIFGAVKLNGGEPGVPERIEKGGTVTRKGADGRTRTLNYQARPHTAPAGETALTKLPGLWAGAIK
jgi:hypothetical protein